MKKSPPEFSQSELTRAITAAIRDSLNGEVGVAEYAALMEILRIHKPRLVDILQRLESGLYDIRLMPLDE